MNNKNMKLSVLTTDKIFQLPVPLPLSIVTRAGCQEDGKLLGRNLLFSSSNHCMVMQELSVVDLNSAVTEVWTGGRG